jgi:hypothetical protein
MQIYFFVATCCLITRFTIFASSTKNARRILHGILASDTDIGEETHRDLTQSPHREPPYALVTVLRRFEIVAYCRGRRAGICAPICQRTRGGRRARRRTPGRLIPQSPHLGDVPGFLRWWYTSRPPGVLTIRGVERLAFAQSYTLGHACESTPPLSECRRCCRT